MTVDREGTAPVPALIPALRDGGRYPTSQLILDAFADRLEAVSSEPGWVAVNTATGEVRRMEPRTVVGAYTPFPHNGCTFTAWRIEEPTDGP